jgi:hypothetical protein
MSIDDGDAVRDEAQALPLALSDDEKLRYDRVVVRDEMSQAQSAPTAARSLGGRHLGRLIYSLDDSSDVVERHIAPYGSDRTDE